jgi:hypothetical protein
MVMLNSTKSLSTHDLTKKNVIIKRRQNKKTQTCFIAWIYLWYVLEIKKVLAKVDFIPLKIEL